jgi:endonuclease/exonuclease/phosphatase family metal-dependent hydrolase
MTLRNISLVAATPPDPGGEFFMRDLSVASYIYGAALISRIKYKHAAIIAVVVLVWFLTELNGTSGCPNMPLQSGKNPSTPAVSKENITVVSLNMAKEARVERILADLRRATFFDKADVFLLQEARPSVDEMAKALGMNYVYAPADEFSDGTVSGLAILSRYAFERSDRTVLPRYNLRFNTRCRIALSAFIRRPAGEIRLVNVHLDTRITQQQRLLQVSSVMEKETTSTQPVIVGGDFNTANVRWMWNVFPVPYVETHTRAVRNMFVEHGFESPLDGVGSTFKLLGFPLHLDWIFPRHLKAVAAGTQQIPFSDHSAVWVTLKE